MILGEDYEKIVIENLNRKISKQNNPDQNKAISAQPMNLSF